MGPVQVLVVGYDEPRFSGEALAEARRLEDAGIVRLIDVLVVARDASGALEVLEEAGLPDGAVARALLGVREGEERAADDAATWSLGDAVPAGGVAVVVLLEHLWASGLVDAISRAGGRPLDELWLGAEDRAVLEAALATRDR
jgi:uncharacterized membrane protein